MKIVLIVISACFFANAPSCRQAAPAHTFFPLGVGNYWIYRDSLFEDGHLSTVTIDTLRVDSEITWKGRKTFMLSDNRQWYESGDTVYQLGFQRTGVQFPTAIMMPSDTPSTFNFIFGGDVVMTATVTKIVCSDSKWNASSCYKISDNCGAYLVEAYGIGIIRQLLKPCSSAHQQYTTRTLMDFHLGE